MEYLLILFEKLIKPILSTGAILLVSFLLLNLITYFHRKFKVALIKSNRPAENITQVQMLLSAGIYLSRILTMMSAGFFILYLWGVNMAPIFATVGIASLAVTLGAQTILRDYIGGIIIFLENLYLVGDTLTIGALSGVVERVTLRSTSLRNHDGQLIVVPNGEVRIFVKNNSAWTHVIIDIPISLESETTQAPAVLSSTLLKWQENPILKDKLLEPPYILGWSKLDENSLSLRLAAKTLPVNRLVVTRELDQLARETFRTAGIIVAG